ISLAWALIGPHVPDVARAPVGNANAGLPTPPQTPPATPVASPPPASMPAGGTCDFCIVGAVPLGGTVSGSISGQGESTVNYHTYTIFVPEGTPTLTIELNADFDVDIAVKFGSEIE